MLGKFLMVLLGFALMAAVVMAGILAMGYVIYKTVIQLNERRYR